tara:strand:- start:12116 stop:13132 length:1017 start_codon:yes stop_codon:yes gene_type:complete
MTKTIIIFLITQIVFGQCVKGVCDNGDGKYIFTNGDYAVGTFKDRYLVKGKYTSSTGDWLEGSFKESNLIEGTRFYKKNGAYAIGTFKDGFLVKGKYIFSTGDWEEGSFKESNLVEGTRFYEKSGAYAVGTFKDGFLVEGKYTSSTGDWEEGSFKESNLIDGTRFHKLSSGQECFNIFKDGLIIQTTCNTQNYYNEDDIVSGPYSSTINLKKFDNKLNAYYINLTINNQKVKFHFDTGCSSFTMNQTQWNELSKGLDYEDLKVSGKIEAVGAEHNVKYYKIIDPIIIDKYSIKNLIVGVTQIRSYKNPDKDNLIGLGFFNKFSNVIWNMSEETIKLYF